MRSVRHAHAGDGSTLAQPGILVSRFRLQDAVGESGN